jgi:hypothetical protein
MRIELLYFRGCPHHEPTIALVRQVLREEGITAEIQGIEVRDLEEAERLHFLGSPSVRVDGVDIEHSAAQRTTFSLSCRMYGASGVPPQALIEAALRGQG